MHKTQPLEYLTRVHLKADTNENAKLILIEMQQENPFGLACREAIQSKINLSTNTKRNF